MDFNFIECSVIARFIEHFGFIIIVRTCFEAFTRNCCSVHTKQIIEVTDKKVYFAYLK